MIADHITISGKQFLHLSDSMLLDDLIFRPQRIGSILALEYQSSTIDERSKVIKRLIDIVGATLGLIITSPLLLWIAVKIYYLDRGPMLFRQERMGKNKEPFVFFKFRTMYLQDCTG